MNKDEHPCTDKTYCDATILSEEIWENYDATSERIQLANYQLDLAMEKLEGCL